MTCIACHGTNVRHFEELSTEQLADRWATLNMHGEGVAPDQIRCFVREDISRPTVDILRCETCGLEFASPGRTWQAAHYPHEQHSLGWDHEQALLQLAAAMPARVLDVGCADGQFLERVAALGHQGTGVDFSPEDVDAARRKGIEAYVADLSSENALVRDNRQFDFITLFQVIEHLEAPDFVFEQLRCLAAQGASLMLGCPSSKRYTRAFRHPDLVGTSDFWDCPPQHSLRWTPAALEAFVLRHGWATDHVAYEPLRPLHAAAHLAGLAPHPSGLHRKVATLLLYLRLRIGHATGIRLFLRARKT